MNNYIVTDAQLTSIANAIRTKGGTSGQLEFPAEFVSAIAAIETGGSTPAAGYDVLVGTAESTEEEQLILTVENVPFTAEGAVVWHTQGYNTHYYNRGESTLLFAFGTPVASGSTGLAYEYNAVGFKGNAFASVQIFQDDDTVELFADAYYNGPYKYVIWGHAAAQGGTA